MIGKLVPFVFTSIVMFPKTISMECFLQKDFEVLLVLLYAQATINIMLVYLSIICLHTSNPGFFQVELHAIEFLLFWNKYPVVVAVTLVRENLDPPTHACVLLIMLTFFMLFLCSPFLFPFECRQQLFYCTAMDRDRALSKLQVNTHCVVCRLYPG